MHVPVCLGSIDMEKLYCYEGIAELEHMMFLSYGGKRLDKLPGNLTTKDKPLISEQLDRSIKAIHNLKVLHTDLELRNVLWDEKRQQLTVVAFERAQVHQLRRILGDIPANQKSTTKVSTNAAKAPRNEFMFVRENNHVAKELRQLR